MTTTAPGTFATAARSSPAIDAEGRKDPAGTATAGRNPVAIALPGGQALLSTPNEHNLQSRLVYLLTGFYGDSRRVLRPDDETLPMRHINMTPPAQLEFVWRSAGLELVNVQPSRISAGALCLLPLVYPVQRLRYWSRLRRLRDPRDREAARRAYDLLNRPAMLTGRVIVYHLRKPAAAAVQRGASIGPVKRFRPAVGG